MKNIISIITVLFCCVKIGYTQSSGVGSQYATNSTTMAALEAGSPATLPDIKYHLTAKPWKALNTPRSAYLSNLESMVRQFAKFQDASGAIIDPYSHSDTQSEQPYANAVATLISAGRAMDLLRSGVAAMNKATARLAIPGLHGEFYLAPLASAIPLYAPHVSSSQIETWKKRMAKPIEEVIEGHTHNWRTYAMKGQWLRAKNGYVNKAAAVSWLENSWITTQKKTINW